MTTMSVKAATDFIEALSRERAAPCDECELRATCAKQRLACLDFVRYVGNVGSRKRQTESRRPTRGMYERVFGGDDEELG